MGKARFFPRLALVNLARNGRFYLSSPAAARRPCTT